MVKGISRRVIVVRPASGSPFEQAFFLVRDAACPRGDAVREACRIAEGCLGTRRRRRADAYFSLTGQIPDEIDGLAYDSSTNVISFSEALSDTQELSVKLKVLYPSSDTEPFIEILQWKTGNTASWTPDTHQPVYKGAQS